MCKGRPSFVKIDNNYILGTNRNSKLSWPILWYLSYFLIWTKWFNYDYKFNPSMSDYNFQFTIFKHTFDFLAFECCVVFEIIPHGKYKYIIKIFWKVLQRTFVIFLYIYCMRWRCTWKIWILFYHVCNIIYLLVASF